MKSRLGIFLALLFASGVASWTFAEPAKSTNSVLRHVVLVKFKEGTKPEQTEKVVEAFGKLPGKISEIAEYEYGTDVSPEKRNEGFTHCFIVTFRNAKDRDTYLTHPVHEAFKKGALPVVDKVLVVDFFTNR